MFDLHGFHHGNIAEKFVFPLHLVKIFTVYVVVLTVADEMGDILCRERDSETDRWTGRQT